MPKVTGTRKQKAHELIERLLRGPSLHYFTVEPTSEDQIMHDVRMWLETWIIPDVRDLVPELKAKPEPKPEHEEASDHQTMTRSEARLAAIAQAGKMDKDGAVGIYRVAKRRFVIGPVTNRDGLVQVIHAAWVHSGWYRENCPQYFKDAGAAK